MNGNPTCDVETCRGSRILVLQRLGRGSGWVEASFCERHAFDVQLQAEVIALVEQAGNRSRSAA